MNRNFKLNLAGNIASTMAGVLYNFCTGLFILDITGSALAMSVFMGYSTVLGLAVQPLAGVFIERREKVKIMYITDGIFALTDFLLAGLLFSTSISHIIMVGLYMNATVNTIMNALFEPASAALMLMIMEQEKLTKAYSLFSIVGNFANIFATLFAAVLFSLFSYQWILVINGCLRGTSAVFEYFIVVNENIGFNGAEGEKTRYIQDLKEGFGYLQNQKVLLQILSCAVIINFFMSGIFSTTLPYLYNTTLGLPAVYLATIEIAMSAGSILMAARLTKMEIKDKGKNIIKGFSVVSAIFSSMFVCYMLFAIGSINVVAFHGIFVMMAFLFGLVLAVIQISTNIIYACNIEQKYMGRVMAFRKTLSTATIPCAMILFGILLDYSDIGLTFGLAGIGVTAATIFVHKQRELAEQ